MIISSALAFPGRGPVVVIDDSPEIEASKVQANVVSPTSPGFAPTQAQDQSQDRVNMRVNALTRISASSPELESNPNYGVSLDSGWFRNPSLFAESIFTSSNDRRRFGARSFQYAVQAGIDFETKSDFILGLMYSPSLNNGRIDDRGAGVLGGVTDIETESHFGTLYLARPINEFFFAGATFTAGHTETNTEIQQSTIAVPTTGVRTTTNSEIFTISPSVFVGFNKVFDTYAISTTVSYLYSESYWEIEDNSDTQSTPSEFARSTGTFSWLVQGSYFLTDKIDISLSHKLTQIVHTNNFVPLGANNGVHDHTWSTIGMDVNWLVSQAVSIYGGVEYDLFNRNYQETISGNVGLSYNF